MSDRLRRDKLLPVELGPAPSESEYLAAELVMLNPGMTQEEVAKRAGLPSAGAVSQAMRLPAIRGYMANYLDDAGATLESHAKVIAEAQQAEKMVVSNWKGETSVVDAGPDHQVRLAGAELGLKVRGELKGDSQSVNIFQGLTDEQVARIADGRLDPATLIDVGPRIRNPAGPGPNQ